MWQFSLYFGKEIFYYIKSLYDDLKKVCTDEKCCIRIFAKDDNFVLLLALPKNIYEKQILKIKKCIIQSILLYYKPKIIIDGINNFSTENISNRIMMDILCSFDIESEKKLIFNKLSLCDKLYLSSFVQFSLVELTKNWQQMASLINQNSKFLNDEYVKFDLMRFLMTGIAQTAQKIEISCQKNNYIVLLDNKKFCQFDYLFFFNSNFDKVLHLIISKFPQKIVLQNYKKFDIGFVNNLYNLFGDKLKLLE